MTASAFQKCYFTTNVFSVVHVPGTFSDGWMQLSLNAPQPRKIQFRIVVIHNGPTAMFSSQLFPLAGSLERNKSAPKTLNPLITALQKQAEGGWRSVGGFCRTLKEFFFCWQQLLDHFGVRSKANKNGGNKKNKKGGKTLPLLTFLHTLKTKIEVHVWKLEYGSKSSYFFLPVKLK